jgi:hypothetical protein
MSITFIVEFADAADDRKGLGLPLFAERSGL